MTLTAHSASASPTVLVTGAQPRAAQAATASSSTAGANAASSTGSTDISSQDFLTLLVAEMKNQDPTQPTDPNQYIQQLVGVNSLQELISINQELGSAVSSSSPASAQSTSGISSI